MRREIRNPKLEARRSDEIQGGLRRNHTERGILPLPAGEGRGEGERVGCQTTSTNSRAVRKSNRSPSPFIPLPLGEGNRNRTRTERRTLFVIQASAFFRHYGFVIRHLPRRSL